MDPDWPRNPPDSIICVLCKSCINYTNRNPERFFRHLMADHQTFHNFNILLEVSLVQPGFQSGEQGLAHSQQSQDEQCPESSNMAQESSKSHHQKDPAYQYSQTPTEEKPPSIVPDNLPLNDLGEFDLSFLSEITQYNSEAESTRLNIPLEEVVNLPEERKQKNGNRHLVPDDLKSLIIDENPERSIKFTLSQRLNTQMVVDDFVLKKKKGPFLSRGGRVINWKCVNDSCNYTCVSYEGQLQDHCKEHNHPAQPELYVKKQARVRIRENLANLESSVQCDGERPVSNVVNDVVNQANDDVREMIGSVDALKQAARRFNRKLLGQDQKQPRTRVQTASPGHDAGIVNHVIDINSEDINLKPEDNIALEKLLKTSPVKQEFGQFLNIEF